ncbi:mannose-6-phosphate isomerase, class I [Xanthovirga aplysinae]|uniref:mannose-6-phosphate isomerase, class I n=1 Tax=Xanthovirga aplysinae TaxID=2529853 RepID=UPI0012BC71B6|nr:mannose-6-phosphate isomerase, class I [Xanthovirga aplysinae]MTI32482.1 mannose-6-phosphate isomerase, class I [Xanthovirga aplysinae]
MIKGVVKIEGKVQNYAWGGHYFIPQLLKTVNPQKQTFAEYWMGAHKNGPSKILNGSTRLNLEELIAQNPSFYLGEKVAQKFKNSLPYLFKVLDVKNMLSIQVHPTKKEAEKGFARENSENIPLKAPYRNYKDDNHKPEVMVALTDFWLLHGFKEEEKIRETLQNTPEFTPLLKYFIPNNYKSLYKHIMELPQVAVDQILGPLVERILTEYKKGDLKKSSPDYWAARALVTQSTPTQNIDRGIFSIYLFNILQINPGQAIYQDAGVPHSYLEGVNMELMANSDNVLRGGLTPKHVDVAELLKHVKFEKTVPTILEGSPRSETEEVYQTPAPDFELSKIMLSKNNSFISGKNHSLDIIIALRGGNISVKDVNKKLTLQAGEVFMAPAGVNYSIQSTSNAILFKASVPREKGNE